MEKVEHSGNGYTYSNCPVFHADAAVCTGKDSTQNYTHEWFNQHQHTLALNHPQFMEESPAGDEDSERGSTTIPDNISEESTAGDQDSERGSPTIPDRNSGRSTVAEEQKLESSNLAIPGDRGVASYSRHSRYRSMQITQITPMQITQKPESIAVHPISPMVSDTGTGSGVCRVRPMKRPMDPSEEDGSNFVQSKRDKTETSKQRYDYERFKTGFGEKVTEYEAIGVNVASKLVKMEPLQAYYAEALITKVLGRGLGYHEAPLTLNTDLYEKNLDQDIVLELKV